MKKFWYVIKDYTDDDFSNEFTGYAEDFESVAEEVAHDYWSEDPSDPDKVDYKIGIKDEKNTIKYFLISAYAKVDFSAFETDKKEFLSE